MITRICTKCNKEFEATLEFFGPIKTGKFGLRGQCKLCMRKNYQKWASSPKAREAKRISRKKYRNSEKGKLTEKNYKKRSYHENNGLDKARAYKKTVAGRISYEKAQLNFQLKAAKTEARKEQLNFQMKEVRNEEKREALINLLLECV